MIAGRGDDGSLDEALPAFISEAQQQSDLLEQLLMQWEDSPADRELLDSLFRCAHTIKGSAGIFGLDRVVQFTHHVESLLDPVREGRLPWTPGLSTLLLQCNDQIRLLVAVDAGQQDEPDGAGAIREGLVARLSGASRLALQSPAGPPMQPAARSRHWHVSIQFGSDTFAHGIDPLTVLKYVASVGTIPKLVCDIDAVPTLEAIDPERCYLAFEFSLDTSATAEQVEACFSFVRDDCVLRLIAPSADPQVFIDLIATMPDNPRLGDILVAVGAITPEQLQRSLQRQSVAQAIGQPRLPLGEILKDSAGLSDDVIDAALRKQQQQRQRDTGAAGVEETRFLRVDADRLDQLVNLLGELVIAGAGASLLAHEHGSPPLIEAHQQITRLVEEVRHRALQLRMVPIGDTFARFRRVIRDTAAELGKQVMLQIQGAETELDKSMVERIADPLMHLVRNGLDHGLETPAERLAAGKPAQGTLTLGASHESGGVLIRISDDGRGIQLEQVLRRAWERGLVPPGVEPPDAEVVKLIFEPGFSTATQVTNLSGRGVGMDVVRRNIESLRGTISITSQAGAGTCFLIRLPLTLAIIDGFLVGVGGSRFIFALESVVEVIQNPPVGRPLDECGRGVVALRGQVLPLLCLRTLYGLSDAAPSRCSVVVVQAGERRFGVRVDSLLGQHQTVIKPLGRLFHSLQGICGSSILGTGEVALILDVHSLGDLAAAEST